MSAKPIREATGKLILNKYLKDVATTSLLASVDESTSYDSLITQNPWLTQVVSFRFLFEKQTNQHILKLPVINLRLTSSFFTFLFQPLVAKPDQLIKRRGKLGLVLVNKNIQQVQEWIDARINKDIEVRCFAFTFISRNSGFRRFR